jgi:hypothetical protein
MRLTVGKALKVGDRVVFEEELRQRFAGDGWVVDADCAFTVTRIELSPLRFGKVAYCESAPGADGATVLFYVDEREFGLLVYEWDTLSLSEKEARVNEADGWRRRRDANLVSVFRPAGRVPRRVL